MSIVKDSICYCVERAVALRCCRFASGLASQASERRSADQKGRL